MTDSTTSNGAPKAPGSSVVTPRIIRTSAAANTVPSVRTQIAHEMEQEFVRCEFDTFAAHYLPFDPEEEHIHECVTKKLRQRKLVAGAYLSDLHFTKYTTPPSNSSSEMDTYKDLQAISEAIGRYEHPERSRNDFHYRDTPYSHINSDIPGSTHKVDACFTSDPAPPTRSETAMQLSTTAMAVPMEYKLNAKKRYDNNKQIVSANVQIMNDDVRRMFTFGITIEGDQVTLWFHSRSHSAVSKPFSFVDEPKKLIKVFMSILFAKDEELGYDPNVTLDDNSKYTFKIQKGDGPIRSFRTIDPIAEYRSNNITGRMTRIFTVTEVDTNPPKIFVLKDVWIEEKAQTEGQIQNDLFRDIEKFWNNPTPNDKVGLELLKSRHAGLVGRKEYKDYFLSIETECEGFVSKPAAGESHLQRGLFYPPPPAPARPVSLPLGSAARISVGTPRPMSNIQMAESTVLRKYAEKKQYRAVFREICESVGDLETLGEVTDVLQQVLIPLQLMFCAGWVHRDISSGNILAYPRDKSWQVKLSDLEYARRFPPPPDYIPGADPKTGTPYFMPHEILAKMYIYSPADDKPRAFASQFSPSQRNIQEDDHQGRELDKRDNSDSDHDEGGDDGQDPNPFIDDDEEEEEEEEDTEPNRLVVHNFQHDLESVWWLLLWNLTARISRKSANDWAKTVFQNSLTLSTARRACFEADLSGKMSRILPKVTKDFASHVEDVRHFMKAEYRSREKSQVLNSFGTYVDIHNAFEKFFKDIQSVKPPIWRKIKLSLDSPYKIQKPAQDTAAANLATDASKAPAAPVEPSISQTPAPGNELAPPARVKRNRPDNEQGPSRRPGPSKRSKHVTPAK